MKLFLVAAALLLALASVEAGTTLFYGPFVKYVANGDHYGAVPVCGTTAAIFGGNRVEVAGYAPKLNYVNQVRLSDSGVGVIQPKTLTRNVTGNVALLVGSTRVYTLQLYTPTVRSDLVLSFNYTNCTKWQLISQVNASSLLPSDLIDFDGAVIAGRYPVWAGGERTDGNVSNVALVVDSTTDTASVKTLSVARSGLAAVTASTDGKVWLAGGANRANLEVYDTIDVISSDLTVDSSSFALSEARGYLAGASSQGVIVFGGGVANYTDLGDGTIEATYSKTVDIYNLATNAHTTAHLSVARGMLTATATTDFIVFAGGVLSSIYNASTWEVIEETNAKRIDIYHIATNTWAVAELSNARAYLSSTAIDNTVLFTPGSYYEVDNGTYSLNYTSSADAFLLAYGTSPAAALRPSALFARLLSFIF
jgi:hypothetical protein